MIADELGLRPEDIEVITQIDTSLSDWSIASGNYANRFSGADTTAAVFAARKVAHKLKQMAAAALSCKPDEIELRDGFAQARDRNVHIQIKQLAASSHWNSANMPEGLVGGIQETGTFTLTALRGPDARDRVRASLTTTLMCDIAAVRVDADTGQVEIKKYVVVHDTGRLLNPALAEGQLRGGFAHGYGAALLERLLYDGRGNLLTGTLADYLCPAAADMPVLSIAHAAHPTDQNATGARGLGDGSCMNAPGCLANAIADAIGSGRVSIPATPSRLWSIINGIAADAHLAAPPPSVDVPDSHPGALRGEGEQLLPGRSATVWKALFEIDELAKIIPGCQHLREVAPNQFEAMIVVSIAGMRSSYHATIELADRIEPTSLRIRGRAEGKLGFGDGEARIRLTSEGNSTRLSYRYSADVGGRIAGVGQRMLDSVVRLLLRQFFGGLTHHLDPSARSNSAWSRMRDALRRLFSKERNT